MYGGMVSWAVTPSCGLHVIDITVLFLLPSQIINYHRRRNAAFISFSSPPHYTYNILTTIMTCWRYSYQPLPQV